MANRIQNYKDFYPFYLSEHQNKNCRLLHVIGTTLVFLFFFLMIYYRDFSFFWSIPFTGYLFAWVGHFFFEKNKPATFKYPLWSLKSDFKMYFDILRGRLKIDASTDNDYRF